ncbi:LLM class flavin-dependent oxidoreductase [Methylobacterium oryzae CBMB20]
MPLRDPNFGDVGQIYDPWVWLGWIAAQTREIALAMGSIVLPLRHPIHTAKAAGSMDRLSGGRFVMGVASGDRPIEFPAFGVPAEERDVLFRESLGVIRTTLEEGFPTLRSRFGRCSAPSTSCRSRSGGCRSSSPDRAGRVWSGSPSMRTAGSPTRAPLNAKPNSRPGGGP